MCHCLHTELNIDTTVPFSDGIVDTQPIDVESTSPGSRSGLTPAITSGPARRSTLPSSEQPISFDDRPRHSDESEEEDPTAHQRLRIPVNIVHGAMKTARARNTAVRCLRLNQFLFKLRVSWEMKL
jgi:hypothetical protein